MTKNKKISICIPTFNRSNDMDINIRNIIDYSFEHKNFEIEICVSDNSSDNETKKVVEKWSQYYSKENVKYKKNEENIGAGRNFVQALSMSSGEYVVLLGDDDLLTSNFFEQIKLLKDNDDIAFNFFDRTLMDENERILGQESFSTMASTIFSEQDFLEYLYKSHSIAAIGSYISSIIFNGEILRDTLSTENGLKHVSSPYNHVYILAELARNFGWEYKPESIVLCRVDNDSFLNGNYLNRIKIDTELVEIWGKVYNSESIKLELECLLRKSRPISHFMKAKSDISQSILVNEFVSENKIFNEYRVINFIPKSFCTFLYFIYKSLSTFLKVTKNKTKRNRILIVQNYPTPYRVALFNELYKIHNIEVLYLQQAPSERKWEKEKEKIKYPYVECKCYEFNFMGHPIHIPNVKDIPAFRNFSQVLIFTNYPDFFGVMLIKLMSLFYSTKQKIWVTSWKGHKIAQGSAVASFLKSKMLSVINRILFSNVDSGIGYCESSVELSATHNVKCVSSSQFYPLEDVYGKIDEIELFKRRMDNYDGKDSYSFLAICYLSPRKDLEKAIRVISKLPNCTFNIVGSGDLEYTEKLKKLALGSSNINFLGHKVGEDKNILLQHTDFLLFTTKKDSWGYVLNEAFYNAVPVIGSCNAMSVKDLVINGCNGFEFQSEEELKELITKLVSQSKPEFRYVYKNMIKNAYSTIDGFNEKVLNNFNKLLTYND